MCYQPYWVKSEDWDDDVFDVRALGSGDVGLQTAYVIQSIPRQQGCEGQKDGIHRGGMLFRRGCGRTVYSTV